MNISDLTAEQQGEIAWIGSLRALRRDTRRRPTKHVPGQVVFSRDDRVYVIDGDGARRRLRHLTASLCRELVG